MIEIASSERKDNQKGKWLVLIGKNDKGEAKTWNIFDNDEQGKAIIEKDFKGPGKYGATYAKKGGYWTLATLKLEGVANAAVSPAPSGSTHLTTVQNPRVVGASVSIEAAGKIVCGLAAAGYYKDAGIDNLYKDATVIAGQLFKEFWALVNPSAVPTTAAKPEGA